MPTNGRQCLMPLSVYIPFNGLMSRCTVSPGQSFGGFAVPSAPSRRKGIAVARLSKIAQIAGSGIALSNFP